jgi:hypothetical protein
VTIKKAPGGAFLIVQFPQNSARSSSAMAMMINSVSVQLPLVTPPTNPF